MRSFKNVTFNSNMESKRIFWDNYKISYEKDKEGNTLAYLTGYGQCLTHSEYNPEGSQILKFNNTELLDILVNFGEYLVKTLPNDIETKRKEKLENKIIYNDKKIKDVLEKILPNLLEIVEEYGISIDKEANSIFRIIQKSYIIYKVKQKWAHIANIINERLKKVNLYDIKYIINLINGNMLDYPVKYVMVFNENKTMFDLVPYSLSLTSIATYQLMLFITNDIEFLFKRCEYCNCIFEAHDKRQKWCGSDTCRTEKRRREKIIDRQRDTKILELKNKVIDLLNNEPILLKKFSNQYNNKIKLIPTSKGGKDKMIVWLSDIIEKGGV